MASVALSVVTQLASKPLPAGAHEIVFQFDYDGGGRGKSGTGMLIVDGGKVASGRIDRTQPLVFSADETTDIGIDLATAVVAEIGAERKSRFTGKILDVTVSVAD